MTVAALFTGLITSGFATTAHTAETLTPTNATAAIQKQSFPTDGIYLFGQSSKPDQIGKAYAVLEVRQGTVMGALYMPYSSFDCVQGKVQGNKLALNVTDSYERTTRPYAVALESNASIATVGNRATVPGLRLQGFHPLPVVSENDQRMLNTCKADFLKGTK